MYRRELLRGAAALPLLALPALPSAELRRIAPGAGSYVSESNYFNAQWSRACWGEHYPRLRTIKAQYDPDGLFFVHNGVGSEDWSADGFTRLA
jgi:hypothetical protein